MYIFYYCCRSQRKEKVNLRHLTHISETPKESKWPAMVEEKNCKGIVVVSPGVVS